MRRRDELLGKKGLLKFLLSLIIAGVLIGAVTCAFAKLWSAADGSADQSYRDVVGKIAEVGASKSGTMDSVIVNIYKDGGIVGFNEEPWYKFRYQASPQDNMKPYYVILKPKECPSGQPCVCSCREIGDFSQDVNKKAFETDVGSARLKELEESGIMGSNMGNQYVCVPGKNKISCTPLSLKLGGTFAECNQVVENRCVALSANGGFLVSQKFSNQMKKVGVRVENYQGVVGVCTSERCFGAKDARLVDFSVLFKGQLFECVAKKSCSSLESLLGRLLSPLDDGVAWTLDVKMGEVRPEKMVGTFRDGVHALPALLFTLETKDFQDVSYLIENPEGLPGPFHVGTEGGIPYKSEWSEFAFDEFNSTNLSNLQVVFVEMDLATGLPKWEAKRVVKEWKVYRENANDVLLTVEEVKSLQKNPVYWLADLKNDADDPAFVGVERSPPFSLVVFYKLKVVP